MRRVRRKAANKEKVFGCDLLEHLSSSAQEVPLVLRCCSEFVEQHGVVDGIYRLSGVSSNIQKLRGEFEGDGGPDLNKDLYLQDIHCVSSLCKAYFRELPNPLLTYQLYDKFAEAVALQLEDERLVKIRDVLKELPPPHYRTLEFLMRHLVKMASFSPETNMHARNLAIVWAPNLLRSKDIETSGFNGTAAFMEVRVQSIVVEFILSHVAQLFPDAGDPPEKSLSSPSLTSTQDDRFFKQFSSTHTLEKIGNLSPGDGPLPIRPYHAIIDGTDKRKSSLKGRKWISIFNIGGRFQDQRRRHKHSTKGASEKEPVALKPARSMDSLRLSLNSQEGSINNFIVPPAQSSPAGGSSEYAITYRRGTGHVVGGTKGTYTPLDPEGLSSQDSDGVQSRSPGLSSRGAGRRAAMHITGPTMVTVPLHITSNLALGLLQGGGADRVVHRSRERGVNGDGEKERREDVDQEKVEVRGGEGGGEEGGMEGGDEKVRGEEEERGGKEEKEEKERGNEKEEKEEEERGEKERVTEKERGEKKERGNKKERGEKKERGQSVCSIKDTPDVDENVDMKAAVAADGQRGAAVEDGAFDDGAFNGDDVLNSSEIVDDELSGYVQDNFEFLDQMDCSVLDHMDHGAPYQVQEFSVEPPGHNEYELMEQTPHEDPEADAPLTLRSYPDPGPNPNLRVHRHTKSLSLPYMTSPVGSPEEPDSDEDEDDEDEDEDEDEDDDDDEDFMSDEDDNILTKSLPPCFFLNERSGSQGDELLESHQTGGDHVDGDEDEDDDEDAVAEDGDGDEGQAEDAVDDSNDIDEDAVDDAVDEDADDDEDVVEEVDDEGKDEEKEEKEEEPLTQNDLDHLHVDCEVEEENLFPPPPPDCLDFPLRGSEDEEEVAAGSDEEQRGDAMDSRSAAEMLTDGSCGGGDEEPADIWGEMEEVVCGLIEDEEKRLMEDEEKRLMEEDEEKRLMEDEEKRLMEEKRLIEEEKKRLMEDEEKRLMEDEEKRLMEKEKEEEETLDRVKSVAEEVSDDERSRVQLPDQTPPRREPPKPEAVTRTLVVSRPPVPLKVYQAKAVPVVPPKPQHCKIAALTLRQQLREKSEPAEEEAKEARPADGSSPISMCFDEAVAIATMRREKRERQWEWGGDTQ